MGKRVCLKCGKRGEIDGHVDGIRPTVCCKECCLAFIVPFPALYAGTHRYPEKLARRTYGCSKKDLSELEHSDVFYSESKKEVRLYLGAEVECLGLSRNKRKWSEERKRRKKELWINLGIKFKTINPLLRACIVGDYLRCPGTPTTTLKEISQRWSVLERVKSIRSACNSAHPMAVFDFCIARPTAGPKEFEEYKEKMHMVFRLEGARIMQYMTPAERETLMKTPLSDCVEDYNESYRRRAICSCLEQWVAADVAKKIVEHSACQLRIDRGDNAVETAKKLLKFWKEKDDRALRRGRLTAAFTDKGVHAVGSSLPQKMYIFGLVDCEAEEIVGLEEISSKGPFSLLSENRIEKVSIAVTRFEECLHSKRMSYHPAIEEAIRYAQKVPLPLVKNVSESWDLQQLATGYWSRRWYLL